MRFSFRHLLWMWSGGPEKKPKPAFATDQEAYEFCQRIYKESGGVPSELRRAYEFYLKNIDDDCRPGAGSQAV
jgi:hypothetical protein